MKRIISFLLLIPAALCAQNYIASGDSCFSAKNYACAGTFYDRYLQSDSSNGIAQRSVHAWALSGDKEKTMNALRMYAACNYANGIIEFSHELLANSNLNFIKNDLQWKELLQDIIAKENDFKREQQRIVDSAVAIQSDLEKHGMLAKLDLSRGDAAAVYKKIVQYNHYPAINRRFISLQFHITDSLLTAMLVVLPNNYNPAKPYALLFSLHGAVFFNVGYPAIADGQDSSGANRFYTKYADQVIIVYPRANKDYNWMFPDNGFFMVPAMLRQLKEIINIDDNRVFITGHSNGATGSFSYLMKQPSAFAAFYGFNTRPRVETGGTYLKNILNRSFFNISTDSDYYYPPAANDSLSGIMKTLGADYQDNRYNGFPHWFPSFDESEPAHALLFKDLARRKRNPFHPSIYWECDDVKYGQCDWLKVTGLDTAFAGPARVAWQQHYNFEIKKWVVPDNKGKTSIRDTSLLAFNYGKRSGAARASYANNVFSIETSCIKSLSILLSPNMVDLNKPITVVVNGRIYYKQKSTYSKAFIIKTFLSTLDRCAVWINRIDITI